MKTFDRTMIFAMVFAFTFPVAVTLAVNRAHWGPFLHWLAGESGAGWAQAVGTVVSLVYGSRLVSRQISANRELEAHRRRMEARDRRRRSLLSMRSCASRLIGPIRTVSRNSAAGTKPGAKFTSIMSDLMDNARLVLNAADYDGISLRTKKSAHAIEIFCKLYPDLVVQYRLGKKTATFMQRQCDQFREALREFAEATKADLDKVRNIKTH